MALRFVCTGATGIVGPGLALAARTMTNSDFRVSAEEMTFRLLFPGRAAGPGNWEAAARNGREN